MIPDRTERLRSLFARTHSGIKPGLERVRGLLRELGNPQDRFLSVHVAGTNGKGSTCALIESCLRERGLRTGLFTSPHLVQVNERIQLAGKPIDDDLLFSLLDRIDALEGRLEEPPSFFETLTALGFLAFAEAGVQVAVVEVGLGGRLDCTNILTPLLSVITRIDFDHMALLGNTLTLIAGEKAGILKPGRPAVIAAQESEARDVLLRRAADLGCSVLEAPEHCRLSGRKQTIKGQTLQMETPNADYGKVSIPLPGAYQLQSLATAVTALEECERLLNLPGDPAAMKRGLAAVAWPGRCQALSEHPPILLDVAHNPGGARALAETLRELFGRKARGVFVIGQMKDKDNDGFLKAIAPVASHCLCVAVDSPRAQAPEELVLRARKAGISAEACTLQDARKQLPNLAAEAGFGCVAGSVYLAGAWLEGVSDPGEFTVTAGTATGRGFRGSGG
jgi:dihydrofolate synthase/folylpolyglutamate synthase